MVIYVCQSLDRPSVGVDRNFQLDRSSAQVIDAHPGVELAIVKTETTPR